MTPLEIKTIKHTNDKLMGWYENAKIDSNIDGFGVASIKGEEFVIDYVENGESKQWRTCYFEEYLSYGLDYFYSVWMEEAK